MKLQVWLAGQVRLRLGLAILTAACVVSFAAAAHDTHDRTRDKAAQTTAPAPENPPEALPFRIGGSFALIDQDDAHAVVQERELAQAARQNVVVKIDVAEDLPRGEEVDLGTAFLGSPGDAQRCGGHAIGKFQLVHLAVDEIRTVGASAIQVDVRLRAMLEDLLTVAPPQRRASIENELALLEEGVRRDVADFPDRERIMTDDPGAR